jgi:hypothetical protein
MVEFKNNFCGSWNRKLIKKRKKEKKAEQKTKWS